MASVINVAGTSRSGSTVLHLMLANSPDAFACGEAVNLYRPEKRHHFTADCICGSGACTVWKHLAAVPESRFYQAVEERLGARYIVDSSKEICWVLDAGRWARRAAFERHLVFVWKDPFDLAYSFWKRGLGPNYWRGQMVRYYGKVLAMDLHFVSVSQSELRIAPATKLRQLCALIGMTYFEGKERFWEKQHHFLFGSSGVRSQASGGSRPHDDAQISAEFRRVWTRLERELEADRRVQLILEELRRREVSRLDSASARPAATPSGRELFTPWYYAKKARRRFRRFLPLRGPAEESGREANARK